MLRGILVSSMPPWKFYVTRIPQPLSVGNKKMSALSRLKNATPRRVIDFTRGFAPPDLTIARSSPVLAYSKNNKLEYVPANVPAFGYRDGSCLGLQLTAGATNLCRVAIPPPNPKRIGGIFHEWGWNDGVSAMQSTVSAPDGTTTAVNIYRDTVQPGVQYKYLRYFYQAALSDNVVRTYSFYAKAGTSNNVDAILANDKLANVRVRAYFTLTGAGSVNGFEGATGTYLDTGRAGIVYVGDGWYRCWLTAKFLSAPSYTRLPNLIVYPGIRSTQNEGDSVNIWGFQHEAAYRPNSLVITSGAEVTAVGDTITTADNFGYGTMVASAYIPSAGSDISEMSLIGFGDTNAQARIAMGFGVGGTTSVVRARLRRASTDIVHTQTATTMNPQTVMAASFSNTGVNVAYRDTNEYTAYQDTTSSPFVGLKIGQWTGVSSISMSGYIKKIALFDQTMTAEELAALVKLCR